MHLVPVPQVIRPKDGFFDASRRNSISTNFEISSRLRSALETFSFLDTSSSSEGLNSICLVKTESHTSDEAYRLSIETDGITIGSSSDCGFFRGLTTLSQIVDAKEATLPCIQIEDHPDLTVRGYMLDISRCKVPTMESLFQLIDSLASLKYNQLQLYTEHAFAYRNHRTVWENASPLTADEILILDTYCYHRFIDLVPNQNSFGHMDRWLRHEPYKHLAECPNGYMHPISGPLPWGGTLKPNQASLDFVAELYDELLPHFRSDLFNIGGDEPWELGQGWSREEVEAKGKHRVYLDHLLKLHELVASRGKTMQFWGDILLESPELAKELPRDVVGLIWGYEAGHPFEEQCRSFCDSGIPFYVAPGTSAWNTIGGRQANAAANIKEATKWAIRHGARGMLLTDWGDFGHHHFPPISYPAMVWASTLSWNQKSASDFDPIQAVNTIFFAGQSPELAESIKSLSDLANAFSYQPENRTLLNDLLFTKGEKFQKHLSHTDREELETCRSGLYDLLDTLKGTKTANGNASIAKQELILATKMLRCATEKSLAALEENTAEQDALPSTLASLIQEFRSLWLQRNRPGGLDESANYLEKSLAHS